MEDYLTIDALYKTFNEKLFKNELPECIITLQRKRNCCGYFSAERFLNLDDTKTVKDEIALNPETFKRGQTEIMQTIVHEMCHLWQHHFGEKKSRTVYHNKEWADKMESIGLIPSNTGAQGGKRTGQKMSDYPLEGGLFLSVANKINKTIKWGSKIILKPKTENNKGTFVCPNCEQKAWAKKTASLLCGVCTNQMILIDK